LKEKLAEFKTDLEVVNKKNNDKETEALTKKAEKLNVDIDAQTAKIERVEAEKAQVILIFKKYYEGDKLKDEFAERTDTELMSHFKNGVLSRYKSDDIVLRNTELLTILDNIRKEVVWE
jgi:type I restriction enzyme M protein